MTTLNDYANDVYSQDGEDGCIEAIFTVIGEKSHVAVEFGAGEIQGSNTAQLWKNKGWRAYLIESDAERFETLLANVLPGTHVAQQTITPTGVHSIDSLMGQWGVTDIDFMSIDVDGDDYLIFESMALRPRVVCIEFNPTIPPHVYLRQKTSGERFGSSLLSIATLARTLGYEFVGATRCNGFFVLADEAEPFCDYEKDLGVLFPPENYSYFVTDFSGRSIVAGAKPPWDSRQQYVLPLEGTSFPTSDDPEFIKHGFEAEWGSCGEMINFQFFASRSQEEAERKLSGLLSAGKPLECIDMTGESLPDRLPWMKRIADRMEYRMLVVSTVAGFIKKENNV